LICHGKGPGKPGPTIKGLNTKYLEINPYFVESERSSPPFSLKKGKREGAVWRERLDSAK